MTSQDAAMEELRALAREATANVALLTAQLARLQPAAAPHAKKKPDLPKFDPNNVEIWVQRIESAYTRVGITEPRDKFAFLESQFEVNFSAKINSFLFDANPTDARWQEFISHLLDRYGPSRRQRAAKFIVELPRAGRTPSEFLAHMEEIGREVTFDDVKKEHLLKSLPPRIREYIGKDADDLTSQEVAEKADAYFDKDGRLLESNSAGIHHVSEPAASTSSAPTPANIPFTQAFVAEGTEETINAVKGARSGPVRPQPPPPKPNGSNSGYTGSRNGNSRAAPSNPPKSEKLCSFHRRFQDNALNCTTGCSRFNAFMAAKNRQQGNANGGRRL